LYTFFAAELKMAEYQRISSQKSFDATILKRPNSIFIPIKDETE